MTKQEILKKLRLINQTLEELSKETGTYVTCYASHCGALVSSTISIDGIYQDVIKFIKGDLEENEYVSEWFND